MLSVPGSVIDRIERAITPFGYTVRTVLITGVVGEQKLVVEAWRKSWDQPAEIAARAAIEAEFPGLMNEGVYLVVNWNVASDEKYSRAGRMQAVESTIEDMINRVVNPYGYRVVARPDDTEKGDLVFGIGCEKYENDQAAEVERVVNVLFPLGLQNGKHIIVKIGSNAVAL